MLARAMLEAGEKAIIGAQKKSHCENVIMSHHAFIKSRSSLTCAPLAAVLVSIVTSLLHNTSKQQYIMMKLKRVERLLLALVLVALMSLSRRESSLLAKKQGTRHQNTR